MHIKLKSESRYAGEDIQKNIENGKHGLFTTMSNGVPIETRVLSGNGELSSEKTSNDPIDYSNEDMDFQIHTGYDQLILSFSNDDIHISVKTGSGKDLIGAEGWRHIAHKVALDLTGKEVIKDAPTRHVQENHWREISKSVVRHIHKLVDITEDINPSPLESNSDVKESCPAM